VIAILEQMFATGTIALVAVAFLVIETAIIAVAWRDRKRIFPVLWNTLSGIGLLGALYAALSGAGWVACAVFLTLGLFGHLGELALRIGEKKA